MPKRKNRGKNKAKTPKKKRICTIKGCNNKHQAKGYCNKHYLRFWTHGDPLKTKQKEPTKKQELAFKALQEMLRNPKGRKGITMGKILKEAGYSKSMQESPNKITNSQGWQQLMEEHFPDGLLTEKMGEQLNAQEIDHYVFSSKTPDEEIKDLIEKDFGFKVMRISKADTWKRAYFSVPDHNSRDKMIEKVLKLKNKYPAEKHEHFVAKVEIVDSFTK